MSGTQDWTGVTASATATVAQGATLTAGHLLVLNLAGMTQTTRSLLFLLANDQAGPGPAVLDSAVVRGSTSGIRWINSTILLSDLGSVSTPAGDGWAPIYVPLYGLVDSAAVATFTFDADYIIHYWVLELPDADLLGSPLLPLTVLNSPYPALEPLQSAPMVVTPSGVWTVDTVAVDPKPHTPHTVSTVAVAAGTTGHVLAAPPAGQAWEIVSLQARAPTVAAGVASFLQYQTLRGGAVMLSSYATAAGCEVQSDATRFLQDGLDLRNGTPVGGSATAEARLVTLS